MKNILLFLTFTILLPSCVDFDNQTRSESNHDSPSVEPSIPTNEDLKKISLTFSDTINVHGTDFTIIPVGASKYDKKGRFSSFNLNNERPKLYGGYYDKNPSSHFNLIFYNVKKDSSHLLLPNENALITWFFPNMNESGKKASEFIFYDIQNKDYNKDGKMTHKDPSYLFVSQKDGSQLTQLTPNNSKLNDWNIIQNSNIIIANVTIDTNGDKIFDTSKGDENRLMKINLNTLGKAQRLLSKETEKTLKTQFLDLMTKEN